MISFEMFGCLFTILKKILKIWFSGFRIFICVFTQCKKPQGSISFNKKVHFWVTFLCWPGIYVSTVYQRICFASIDARIGHTSIYATIWHTFIDAKIEHTSIDARIGHIPKMEGFPIRKARAPADSSKILSIWAKRKDMKQGRVYVISRS